MKRVYRTTATYRRVKNKRGWFVRDEYEIKRLPVKAKSTKKRRT